MTRALDPEIALSIVYAPARARDAIEAIWRLDARLGDVVRATREPLIGRMRLTWWREALAGERIGRGEPVLDALSAAGVATGALAAVAQGWEALLDEPLGAEALADHARLRGVTLFTAIAAPLGDGIAPVAEAGRGWALIDFAWQCSDRATARAALELAREPLDAATRARWPAKLRSLGLLARLASRDLRAGLDSPRRQGSPARLARALRHRLTGR